MVRIFFFLLGLSLLSISAFDVHGNSVINKYDRFGKKTGYWVLGENEDPIQMQSKVKSKEGTFINGRKSGVWISEINVS